MSFAEQMQNVATQLLTKFDERDEKIKLLRAGSKVFDETLGEYVIQPSTEFDLTGVAVPYDESLIDGSTVQAGDIRLTVTNAVEVALDDKIVVDSVHYSVVSAAPIAYTGKALTVGYKVQLRR